MLKYVNEGAPFPNMDATGTPIDMTQDEINDLNHRKVARLSGAQAIAGLLPKEKVEALVNEHIRKSTNRTRTALEILMMRFQFNRDTLLTGSALSEPMTGPGDLLKAIEYVEDMERVMKYPFYQDISISITGFLPPLPNTEEKLADSGAAMIVGMLEALQTRADDLAQVKPMDFGNKGTNEKTQRERNAQLRTGVNKIETKLAYWQSQIP
jgi:hypothetical protein